MVADKGFFEEYTSDPLLYTNRHRTLNETYFFYSPRDVIWQTIDVIR